MPEQNAAPGIDPRGPRFAAALTSALLLAVVFVALVTARPPSANFGWFAYQPSTGASYEAALGAAVLTARATEPAFLLLTAAALLFLWGVLSPRTAPWAVLFRALVQPRLPPPAHLEDPRPPRFAQGVGLTVTAAGLILHLLGVPGALIGAAAVAFVAAFLNAVFGLCLGCLMYLGLQRIGVTGRARPSAS